MSATHSQGRYRLTPKQRFIRRHRTAYCKKHHDCALWCVFKRRDDEVALVCAFTVTEAWEAANAAA